jgi:hypothetical protein
MGVFHSLRHRPQESRPKRPQKFPFEETFRKKEKGQINGKSEPFKGYLSPIASPNIEKPLYRSAERGVFDSYTESEGQQNSRSPRTRRTVEFSKRGEGERKNQR